MLNLYVFRPGFETEFIELFLLVFRKLISNLFWDHGMYQSINSSTKLSNQNKKNLSEPVLYLTSNICKDIIRMSLKNLAIKYFFPFLSQATFPNLIFPSFQSLS